MLFLSEFKTRNDKNCYNIIAKLKKDGVSSGMFYMKYLLSYYHLINFEKSLRYGARKS